MTAVIPTALPAQIAQPAAAPGAATKDAPLPRPAKPGNGRPGIWLIVAAAGLGVLAGAAATVSYAAQYRLVYAERHLAVAAVLEAGIPDAAALVFACLGVALAVRGRRAIRARLLNIASAGTSVFMNVIAAAPGWRNIAVWAMPPTAYALASDTLIDVVRAGAAARQQAGADPARNLSFLAATGWTALWLLRLALAPRSTLSGFRAWVLEECPVAPVRRPARPLPSAVPSLPSDQTASGFSGAPVLFRAQVGQTSRHTAGSDSATGPTDQPDLRAEGSSSGHPGREGQQAEAASARRADQRANRNGGVPAERAAQRAVDSRGVRTGTKTARFLSLVADQHGPLSAIPLASVSRISATVAPQAGLNTGSARAALRRAVLAAQNGEH